ncbi:HotDog domain-containing protein, partial [Tribonema minus]
LHDVTDLLRRYPEYWRDHVLHDTLNYRHGVQCPVVSHDSAGCRLQAVVRFGQQTRGHPDLVHGGITALTFDNLQGWCMFMDGRTNVLTAYLHVDFKAPLPTHTTVLAEVRIDRQEGRKLFASGTIRTLDGSITFATCSSLFIIPRD